MRGLLRRAHEMDRQSFVDAAHFYCRGNNERLGRSRHLLLQLAGRMAEKSFGCRLRPFWRSTVNLVFLLGQTNPSDLHFLCSLPTAGWLVVDDPCHARSGLGAGVRQADACHDQRRLGDDL